MIRRCPYFARSRGEVWSVHDVARVRCRKPKKAQEATGESVIELRTQSGKLLARKDYSSKDREHGYGFTEAAWTPDSRFFVYSLESSGGHQPWHSPVCYFSRDTEKIAILDDQLKDAVLDPQFEIESPDKVIVALWFSKRIVAVSLSSVRVEQRKALSTNNQ